MARGRPPSIPVTRFAWVMDRAEQNLSYRKLADRYYAAFGEVVNYATFQRLMQSLEKHTFYGDRAKEVNRKRKKDGNKCAANEVKKRVYYR